MTEREQLRRHLEFFRELGVEGISRDVRWRVRDPADRVQVPGDDHRGPADHGDHRADHGDHRADHRDPAGRATDGVGGAGAPVHAAAEGDAIASTVAPTSSSSPDPPPETLDGIRADLGDCTRCKLHGGRSNLVFGVGSPTADLVFVGEAPGRDEDRQGIPFVGRAGQLLTRIIAAIGLSRDEVYIANVIKCRPPNNRNPEPDEVATCEPFLFRQLDVIRPRVVVALGGFAIRTLLETDEAVSRLRGRVFDYRGAKLIPTFHPAFLLRSPERKRDVWEDMKRVRALLAEPESTP